MASAKLFDFYQNLEAPTRYKLLFVSAKPFCKKRALWQKFLETTKGPSPTTSCSPPKLTWPI